LSRKAGSYVALSFAIGLAAGALLWRTQMNRSRRDLFSGNRVRRLAALGYLDGDRSRASAGLLRDYVAWERNASLRRRGERMLRRYDRMANG
jgi:hypothetical protein